MAESEPTPKILIHFIDKLQVHHGQLINKAYAFRNLGKQFIFVRLITAQISSITNTGVNPLLPPLQDFQVTGMEIFQFVLETSVRCFGESEQNEYFVDDWITNEFGNVSNDSSVLYPTLWRHGVDVRGWVIKEVGLLDGGRRGEVGEVAGLQDGVVEDSHALLKRKENNDERER